MKQNTLKETLIQQCINLLSLDNELFKTKIIDPLVLYLKEKIQSLYIILVVLLLLIIISNIIIIVLLFVK